MYQNAVMLIISKRAVLKLIRIHVLVHVKQQEKGRMLNKMFGIQTVITSALIRQHVNNSVIHIRKQHQLVITINVLNNVAMMAIMFGMQQKLIKFVLLFKHVIQHKQN